MDGKNIFEMLQHNLLCVGYAVFIMFRNISQCFRNVLAMFCNVTINVGFTRFIVILYM